VSMHAGERALGPDRAQAVQALASLAQIGTGEIKAMVVVGRKAKEPPEVSQLRPTPAAVRALAPVVQSASQSYGESEVVDYEPGSSAVDGQVMFVSLATVPLLQSIADKSEDLANLPLFNPSPEKVGTLRFAAIRAEQDAEVAIFVEALGTSQVVARSKSSGFLIKRGVVDVPKHELLLLGKDIDVILVGGFAFFTDRAAFQRLFDFLDELRRQAEVTFNLVTANLKINGLDQMR
jgi:hypothetical protein